MDVFVVEDSKAVRERLTLLLQEAGALRVAGCAVSASEAMEKFAALAHEGSAPHVAIVDIQLAEGNGMDVLRFVKQHAPATRVIMLTNYAYEQYQKRCTEEGADYFFDKSADFMKVREVLERMAKGGAGEQ